MFFFLLVMSIWVYGFSIWSLKEPENSFLFLQRWRYKGTPEISDIQIKLTRIGSIIFMVIWTILLIMSAVETFTTEPLGDFLVNSLQ